MQQNIQIHPQHLQPLQPEFFSTKITDNYNHPTHDATILSSFAFYRFSYRFPLVLKSNNERNFMNQLIISLQSSAHFQYLVHLTPASSQLCARMKLRNKLGGSYAITYYSIIKLDQIQQNRAKAEDRFKQKCTKMNQILLFLKDKYRMETRLSFWIKRFNDLLRELEEKEITENKKTICKQKSLFENSSGMFTDPIEDEQIIS